MLDRSSPVPLYYQLKKIIAGFIARGEWGPGHMLPTEDQLEEQYGVSRITVRQALKELEQQGAIARFRGKGTFVTRSKIEHSPQARSSLTDFLEEQGMVPGWKVLSAEQIPAPEDVATRLDIDRKERVFRLERLRLANDEPIGYHTAYVSPEFTHAIDLAGLDQGGSLRYLNKQGHLQDSMAHRILEAALANAAIAKLLEIEKGSPVLMIRRLVISSGGRPVEDFIGIYRGDLFQYHIRHLPAVHPINS